MIILYLLLGTLYGFLVLGINEVWVKPYAMRLTRIVSVDLLSRALDLMDGRLIEGNFEVDDWREFVTEALVQSSGDESWYESVKLSQAIEEINTVFNPAIFAEKAVKNAH